MQDAVPAHLRAGWQQSQLLLPGALLERYPGLAVRRFTELRQKAQQALHIGLFQRRARAASSGPTWPDAHPQVQNSSSAFRGPRPRA